MRGEELLGEDILYTVDAVVEERRQEAHLVSIAVVSRAARKPTRMHMLHMLHAHAAHATCTCARYMHTPCLKERGDD